MSIASGMNANIAALTQSQQNASNGVGLLQTADGALSQVTTLLNRAVTLATEGSNSGITTSQSAALNTEFQSIMSEVNQIGATTNFNGQNVFASNAPATFTSTQGSIATTTALQSGSKTTITDSATGGTFVFTATASSKVSDLQAAIIAAATAGTLSAGSALTINGATQASITNTAGTGINVTSTDSSLGAFNAVVGTSSTNTVFISDSSTANTAANTQIQTSINTLSATQLNLNSNVLTSASASQTALTAINAAVTAISAQRGVIGASVNRLNAASDVMANQVTNLQSAVNSVQNADIGKTVANMTQYNVLQSTGMAALQQANQAQQAVLKLVQ
jgi:flagellin